VSARAHECTAFRAAGAARRLHPAGGWLAAGLLLTAVAACSSQIQAEDAGLPPRLTVLVHEDHSFYYVNETNHREGFHHELLERLQAELEVSIEIRPFTSEEALVRAFEAGEGDIMCPATAVKRAPGAATDDSADAATIAAVLRQPLPILRLKVTDDEDFVWVLRKELAATAAVLDDWLRTTHAQLLVANLHAKYFAHLGLLNKFDLVMLKVRYTRDLPKYRNLFEEAGRRHEIDPLFLAAISYQESHWNPKARSFTGVRGLMMLTQNTARALGVTNRLDPRQSVMGGTTYLVQLKKQIEDEIGRPDKSYYALAAYNVGLGHVRDAQELVRRLGRDHTQWSNLRDALPLLSDPEYYQHTRHGKARGHEPVRYVDSIRNFYALLTQLDSASRPSAPGA
jgi:membrane-bound lytic murein transglycosylase MltF